MWILSWKNYKVSKAATFVSALGALVRYGGFLCLFSGLFPAALICIAIGVGAHYWAESIAFNGWKKQVRKNGIEAELRNGNEAVAERLVSDLEKKYAQYILSLMPAPSANLQQKVDSIH